MLLALFVEAGKPAGIVVTTRSPVQLTTVRTTEPPTNGGRLGASVDEWRRPGQEVPASVSSCGRQRTDGGEFDSPGPKSPRSDFTCWHSLVSSFLRQPGTSWHPAATDVGVGGKRLYQWRQERAQLVDDLA